MTARSDFRSRNEGTGGPTAASRTRPGFVYVMQAHDDPHFVKIGESCAPEGRAADLSTRGRMVVLHAVRFEDKRAAQIAEAELHRRFAAFLKDGTKEMFHLVDEIRAWMATLPEFIQPEPRETAVEYLRRVGRPETLAAVVEWERLREHVGTGHYQTLWDVLAGAKGCVEPMYGRVSVVAKGRVFYFPLLAEACVRQGTAPPIGAIGTRRAAKSHREPQVRRWGDKLRAARRRPR